MKILVTGASGFVGSTLVDSLVKSGHDVRVLMRKTSSRSNLSQNEFSIVPGDLRDKEALSQAVRDVEVIYHIAGIISANRRDEYFAINGVGTGNLAKAAYQHAPHLQRFVYVSSLAAGGPAAPGKPRIETDVPSPVSFYGASKLQGETEILQLGKTPFSTIILRPPVVYGPRDRGMLTFFKLVRSGILPSLRNFKSSPGGYSFIHVDDLVQALLISGLEEFKSSGTEIFYAAGDGEYTWDQTMRSMAVACEKTGITLPIPVPLLSVVGKILGGIGYLSGKNVPLNADKVKEIRAPYWTCSSQKLRSMTKYSPYWSLDRGFRQTVEWYRDRAWL